MIGNFIADHVKGSMINEFEDEIKSGIILHRAIDHFTDNHPVVEQSKSRLRSEFRKYAPVIVDVFYDHFLARDWNTYHHQSLDDFATEAYSILESNESILPERTNHRELFFYDYKSAFILRNNRFIRNRIKNSFVFCC